MSEKFPYMKFYPRDFRADDKVAAMCNRERGAYIMLLCIAWDQDPAGTLPDDDAKLAAWVGETRAAWSRMKSAVMAPFTLDGGRWHQKRMKAERAALEKKSESATKAARTRWGRNADASPTHNERNAISESEGREQSQSTDSDISAGASSPVALAVKAVDAWAEKRRGYGLKAANNEHRTVEDWADALMDAPPVIRGGQQVSPLLLVPEAARAHVEKGTDFKHVRYALRCLEGTLDEWRRNGVGGAPSAGRFTDADIERLIPGGDEA